jgi:DNA-binding transcriptional LysR family regulator
MHNPVPVMQEPDHNDSTRLAARLRLRQLQLAGARAELAAIARGASGRLVIGSLMFTGSVLLPRAVARVKAEYPALEIAVREGTQDVLLPAPRAVAAELGR